MQCLGLRCCNLAKFTTVRVRLVLIPAAALAGSLWAHAASLSFVCAPNMTNGAGNVGPAGTCAYLNSTIAALYTSTFNNVNASIYIKYGTTSLGQSQTEDTIVPYAHLRGRPHRRLQRERDRQCRIGQSGGK
jgi:hypothetical protein